MGYCIEQIQCEFNILTKNLDACVKAVISAFRAMNVAQIGWVRSDLLYDGMSFGELADAFRFHAQFDNDGNVYDIWFTGEKLGEDLEFFFTHVAPYVEGQAFVSFSGEDGSLWRYFMEDGKMTEQTGTIQYE